jgi:peroxiredoxin family protein
MDGDESAGRMAIILFSGTVDKLMAASILATGGVAMGMQVQLFLTNWGLMAFKRDAWKTNMKLSAEFAEFGPAMQAAMQAKNVSSWMDNLVSAKELGDLSVVACGMTMELFEIKRDDLEPIVDEVVGVAGFIAEAQDAKITLFI